MRKRDQLNDTLSQITDETPYGLIFAGQSSAWRPLLDELLEDPNIRHAIVELEQEAHRLVAGVADDLLTIEPTGVNVLTKKPRLTSRHPDFSDSDAVTSIPGILLTQIALLKTLIKEGLDISKNAPVSVRGHSQGVLAARAAKALSAGRENELAPIVAIAHLIGAAATQVSKRLGIVHTPEGSPMLSISGATREEIDAIIADLNDALEHPLTVAVTNDIKSHVISGFPTDLEQFARAVARWHESSVADLQGKKTGGQVFNPVLDFLDVSAPFHSDLLHPAVDKVVEWATACKLSTQLARDLAKDVLTRQVDWVTKVRHSIDDGARWLLDLGPSNVLSRITRTITRGKDVTVVSTGTSRGLQKFSTPGFLPAKPQVWDEYLPRLIELGDGRVVVETAFTRLTGRSPIALAGMTPTTVDPDIVAAAANAGAWAELAGGGQFSQQILQENVDKLQEQLEPGRTVQFNSMFMDRFLWNLQFGTSRIVPRARAAGAPFDGVVVSAGIPELEEATELIEQLNGEGFQYVAFKPGAVTQIESIIEIAKAAPNATIIMQVEDGHAGGHHSWENLDDLLLSTYANVRAQENIILLAGGGIGTPEVAADYLSGDWALKHGSVKMPVDGVFIGTAAMTTLEAKTTPEVKDLLVKTQGLCVEDEHRGWVGSGEVLGGMTSGLSHLRADMYEIENAASRFSRLIQEVGGDSEAIAARREEIIEAMNKTAKPYFGDVESMTYAQWAGRFADLVYPWADWSWQDRYFDLLQRIEARLSEKDFGEVESLFASLADVEDAPAALKRLLAAYPNANDIDVTAIDAAWFITLCRKHPKPVPFVPRIDDELLRWWGTDSLWQSHDPRYSADSVRVVPGPVSVAGIDRVNEPIASLLARFENAVVRRVAANGVKPRPAFSRYGSATSAEDFIRKAPHIVWTGHLMTNPATTLDPESYTIVQCGDADSHCYDIRITLDTYWDKDPLGHRKFAVRELNIPLILPASTANGGVPVVDSARLPEQMYALLAATAGVGNTAIQGDHIKALPVMKTAEAFPFGQASYNFTLSDFLGHDHANVTGAALDASMTTAAIVPDALLGPAWPAIYSALGSAIKDDYPVIEGLLNAVHLDHTLNLLVDAQTLVERARVARKTKNIESSQVTVLSNAGALIESSAGRVIEVALEYWFQGDLIAVLLERFAIRGRAQGTNTPGEAPYAGGGGHVITSTPKRLLRQTTVVAPKDMTPFARVSGDFNPIHTSYRAAKVADLNAPIVHGMWLSATAQHVVSALDETGNSYTILGWTYNMYSPVALNDVVEITVERIGTVLGGGLALDVTCRINREVVSKASCIVAAKKTAYVYPGQGIQSQGMALGDRANSAAARDIWERADVHTRKVLGFSIVALVRDNPKQLTANGVTYRHPEGLLNLTQFTQVALATVGFAQTARLREAGALVDGAYFAGHSLGEYVALSAYSGIFPLESVIEIVFYRGATMHGLIPRDNNGRSNYAMGVLRPNQFGVDDEGCREYVESIADATGEFLEIVNYNLAGEQYAIAGTRAGLDALAADASHRAELAGGKGPFMFVPGVDVPFHSQVLRGGVPEFRERLEGLITEELNSEALVGKYIPNLVARPFELTREFAESILAVVPSEPIQTLLDDNDLWDELTAAPGKLARLLLIEILSWQFASPVRWIETQQLLFTPTTLDTPNGSGIGVEHYVEIGLGSAPTLANLAAKTLNRDEFASVSVTVHNVGRDESRVYYTDTDPAVQIKADDDDDPATSSSASSPEGPSQSSTPVASVPLAAASAPVPAVSPSAPAPTPGGTRPADLPFKADDGIRVLIAYANKIRLDQIGDADTTETLTNGVSSRRNQLLMDLSAELGLASIDGAADATIKALSDLVNKLAHSYKPFGPVVNEAIRDRVRKHLGAGGGKVSRIASRATDTWGLEAGWIAHVTAEILLGTREGASVRGGDLATLTITQPGNIGEVDALIDTAVAAVATRFGVAVAPLGASGGAGGAVVDSAALDAFAEQITGEAGILAATARSVLDQLGLSDKGQVGVLPGVDEDADAQRAIVEAVTQELGSDWPKLVAPAFEAAKVVELDDRWASAREDLATLFVAGELPYTDIESHFVGIGQATADQASWWADKARAAGKKKLAGTFKKIAAAALTPIDQASAQARFACDTAVVTGAAPHSIGAAVVAGLLSGGAAVIATSSRVDSERLAFFKELYRTHASGKAKLWVVPANMSSYRDIDALVEWIGNEQKETVGGETKLIKEALVPTLFFPFAAPRVHGTLKDAGAASENQTRLLLWSVERSIAGLSSIGIDTHVNHRLHVILPGSPNRGIFGGDGAYGEVKAAFDAIATRWQVEHVWSSRVSIAHPRIGWVRGTGLMGGNDPLVDAVERVGIRTYSTDEIAAELLALSTLESRQLAATAPLNVDLTGGLGEGGIDLVALKQQAAADAAATMSSAQISESSAVTTVTIPALPTPTQPRLAPSHVEKWGDVTLPLQDMNVIVGFGEVSTWGSSRTRLEAELGMQHNGKVELTAAGVLELAWMMGLVEWQETPIASWVDREGNEVPEAEIYQRYRDEVVARCGIREFVDFKPLVKLGYEQDVAIFLDKDITFQVASKEVAYSFIEIDPEHTIVRFDEASNEWEVTRLSGAMARVPRKATLTRQVGAQLPTDFDPAKWGIPASMIDSLDSFAVWNLVTAVDAFLSSGFSPAELLQAVHPSEVADTQGTGIGGTESMRKLFVDGFLGEDRPQDILQEALPNVLAAHVMQSFIGGYGSMIHPVAACATAAVSIEDACDKIKAGKAQFVVAGAIDDISVESIQGFGDMNATAKTSDMRTKGISDRFFSRANDRRRGGFVEAQGGGTVLITRGDIALKLGLPVLGVIGYSRSFADGAHTSIPAPGLGALGAGRGGRESAFVLQLAALGVSPDDISVVSKHDTSTNANDPNESELYTRLSAAIGRKPGNPLFVISQKTITGHAKGGASVFQTAGLCQLFSTGVIPANRALDCVAPEFRSHAPIVWLREPLALGQATPIKAGLLTSLGFGHVSAMIAVVNPTAFEAAVANEVGDSALATWRTCATGRLRVGAKRRESGMLGHASLYEPIESRRFGKKTSTYDPHEVEAELLLNPEARLGADGLYV